MVVLKTYAIIAFLGMRLLCHTTKHDNGTMAVCWLRIRLLVAQAEVVKEALARKFLRLLVVRILGAVLDPMHVLATCVVVQQSQLRPSFCHDGLFTWRENPCNKLTLWRHCSCGGWLWCCCS